MTEVDTFEEPSRSAVEIEASGTESVCAGELGLIGRGIPTTDVDTIEDPSPSTVEADARGIESVCSGRASVDNVLASGRLVRDDPFGATVPDSLPELITEYELADRDPPDSDALVSVTSGASILPVLVEANPIVAGISALKGLSGKFVPGPFFS